jgi:hypothetical protein
MITNILNRDEYPDSLCEPLPIESNAEQDKQMSNNTTTAAQFKMEKWHKDYGREVAKEVKAHCQRVERAWETFLCMGYQQLDEFGYNEDSSEWDRWGMLCFDAELSDLRTQYMTGEHRLGYMGEELRSIRAFWNELRAEHPDECTCALNNLETLLENLRP